MEERDADSSSSSFSPSSVIGGGKASIFFITKNVFFFAYPVKQMKNARIPTQNILVIFQKCINLGCIEEISSTFNENVSSCPYGFNTGLVSFIFKNVLSSIYSNCLLILFIERFIRLV